MNRGSCPCRRFAVLALTAWAVSGVSACVAVHAGSTAAAAAAAESPDAPLEGPIEHVFVSGDRAGTVAAAYEGRHLRVAWFTKPQVASDSPPPSVRQTSGPSTAAAGPATIPATRTPRVVASTDAPGHWNVRDWRSWPMVEGVSGWTADLPLQSASVPVVYFVTDVVAGTTNQSPLRWFRPRLALVPEPTYGFVGHLEGFERGIAGWEWGGAGDGGRWMGLSTNAWSGRASLRIEVPSGRGSATVGTARIRGWMLDEHAPKALIVAARMEQGSGRLRFALHGDARTESLAVFPAERDREIGAAWQRVEIPLPDFIHLRRTVVDWFTVQLLADSGRAVLLDDVELVLR